MKKWNVLHKQKADKNQQIKDEEIVNVLLKNRGITKKREIEEFLNPSLDAVSIKGLNLNKKEVDKAVNRIQQAIKNKESVVVYSDYDVDGLTGGAIIWETLYELGSKVMPYIPHRSDEGYGLSQKGIDNIIKEHKVSLLITIDHGISAARHVKYAKQRGIETIIIDHHLLPKKLPKAYAIVHTTQVAAGALAWYFCNYLKSYFTRIPLDKLLPDNLDLAALATIADMIPLKGINRAIVKFGLKELNKTKRIGLKALIQEASIDGKEIGVYEVGRIIAPRINALGRMSHALDALRLICTKDKKRAEILALTLGSANRERQKLTEETTVHAMNSVNIESHSKFIFVAHESYQQGIIGLVAGKLVERFLYPAVVVAKGKEYSKASARSTNGINILEIIWESSDLLIDVGGHPKAAGFTIATKNLDKFKKRMELLLSEKENQLDENNDIKIDMEINVSQISMKLIEIISCLSPFGLGNPEPVFTSCNLVVLDASRVGKNRNHLKLVIQNDINTLRDRYKGSKPENNFKAIGFNLGEIYKSLIRGRMIDIVYTPEKDTWMGNSCLQLNLKDVKIAT